MRRKLTLSIIDQGVVSAFNFCLNLYLIKVWTPENFGLFATVAAASIFASMVQNALVNTPLAVHFPSAPSLVEKAVLRRVFSAANLILTILVMLVSWCGLMFWLGTSQTPVVLAATLYVTTQFVREYYRALLAVEGRLGALLAVDLAYVLLVAGALFYLHWRGEASLQTLSVLLLLLSAIGLVTILQHVVPGKLSALRLLLKEMTEIFAKQMHEIRWSLLGVITTDIQNRGYIFVAAAFFGPTTVAHLQAGRIFFGPLNLLTSAWARVARPHLAALYGKGDAVGFNALLMRALWSFIALNILFLIGLWLIWPYLSAVVFGDKYKGLGMLIAAWGIANLAFQIRSCLGTGVQALRRFRHLTIASIYGAVLSAMLVAAACIINEPLWMIASVIGGECVAIAVVINILRQYAHEARVISK